MLRMCQTCSKLAFQKVVILVPFSLALKCFKTLKRVFNIVNNFGQRIVYKFIN